MRSDLKTDYIQRDTERAGQTEKALYLLNTISAITDRGNNAEVLFITYTQEKILSLPMVRRFTAKAIW